RFPLAPWRSAATFAIEGDTHVMTQAFPGWRRRTLLRLGSIAALGGLPLAARSQRPSGAEPPRLKLATLTTGFATGGSSDVTARLLADYLSGKYAETVIVENRVGASGRLAVEHAKAG